MTILDQIKREAEALPIKERQKALRILRTLRNGTKAASAATPRKTLGKARAAIKATQGIWRNRTDLPSDTVEASRELRRRLMRRSKNG